MAKIIQLIETDSTGHLVRLNDGHVVLLKHSDQGPPTVGSELNEDDFLFDHWHGQQNAQNVTAAEISEPHGMSGVPLGADGPGTGIGLRENTTAEILAADRATDRREDLSEQTLDDRERG